MRDWKKGKLLSSASIREAMEVISQGSLGIALIVDDRDHLLGVVTDGDIRRGLLRHLSLEDSVSLIMNKNSIRGSIEDGASAILGQMQKNKILHLPLVDDEGKVIGLSLLSDFLKEHTSNENLVFLFAGGIGSRLRPLTDDCPKPLLNIGNRPILENIIENFIENGMRKFYISVNYKAKMIMDHFGNGEKLGIDIEYVQEKIPLGTAGSLSLLPKKPSAPIIVMNGDLLTKVDFGELLNFHKKQGSSVTVCVREHDIKIPYGVVKCDGTDLTSIDEKPVHKFFVNAGIYVIEPEVLNYLQVNTHMDMPDLISKLKEKNHQISTFPIFEYWLDIGQKKDFKRAQKEIGEHFKNSVENTTRFLN